MKISNEQIQQIQQAYGVKSKGKVSGVDKSAGVQRSDAVSVSMAGQDIQKALAVVANLPEPVRHDLVNQIKQQLESGTYKADANAIVDGLFSRE